MHRAGRLTPWSLPAPHGAVVGVLDLAGAVGRERTLDQRGEDKDLATRQCRERDGRGVAHVDLLRNHERGEWFLGCLDGCLPESAENERR